MQRVLFVDRKICIAILCYKRPDKLKKLLSILLPNFNYHIYIFNDLDASNSQVNIQSREYVQQITLEFDHVTSLCADKPCGPNQAFTNLMNLIDDDLFSTVAFFEEDIVINPALFHESINWFHFNKEVLLACNIWSIGSRAYQCPTQDAYLSQRFRIWGSVFDLPTFRVRYQPIISMRALKRRLDLSIGLPNYTSYLHIYSALLSNCFYDVYDYQFTYCNVLYDLVQLIVPIQFAEHDCYDEHSYNFKLKSNPISKPAIPFPLPLLADVTHAATELKEILFILDSLPVYKVSTEIKPRSILKRIIKRYCQLALEIANTFPLIIKLSLKNLISLVR